MSESSEVDQISQETGRAARRAGAAVAAIVDRAKQANPKMKRLSWADRKAARKEVSRILREERELEKLEAQQLRVELDEAIRAHHTAVWHGHQVRADEPMEAWYDRQQQLSRSRTALQQRLVSARLSETERGQAVRALQQAHYLPAYQLPGKIFVPTSGLAAARSRVQARIARWRATPLSPEQMNTWQRQQQVQVLNWDAAQLRRAGGSEPRRQAQQAEQQGHQLHEMREAPAQPAFPPHPVPKTAVSEQPTTAAGVVGEQAGPPWETDWLQSDVVQDLRRAELDWLRYDRDPFSPVPLDQVRAGVRGAVDAARAAGLSEAQITWELANVEANSRAHTTLSYRSPTSPGSVERIHGYHPTEAEAAEWAHDLFAASEWEQGTKFAVMGVEAGKSEPYLKLSGDETEVKTGVQQWRAGLAEQARQHETPADSAQNVRADTVHLDGDQVVTHATDGGGPANVQVNGDTTLMTRTREQQLKAKVAGLEKKLGGLTAERDQYRTERDEAVAKLVQATPPEKRYGSPQRRARETQPTTNTSSNGSPVHQAKAEDDALRTAVQAMNGRQEEAIRLTPRLWQERGPIPEDQVVHVFDAELREQLRNDPKARLGFVDANIGSAKQEWYLKNLESMLDFDEVVEENMRDALRDADSPLIQAKGQELTDQSTGQFRGEEFAAWWGSGGAEKYWAERDARKETPTHNGSAKTAATAVVDDEHPTAAVSQELFDEDEEPVIELTEDEN